MKANRRDVETWRRKTGRESANIDCNVSALWHDMRAMKFPLFRINLCLPLAAILLFVPSAFPQVIAYNFNTNDWRGDRLDSLGIDLAGRVWIAGEHYDGQDSVEALLQFTGDSFNVTPLSLSPSDYPLTYTRYGLQISRDAQYVIASVPLGYSNQTVLWSRDLPRSPQFLGEFVPGDSATGRDVASTPDGPVVVGDYGFGTFFWTPAAGFSAWMTNSEYWPLRFSHSISADASKWVGHQYTLAGTTVNRNPYVGTKTHLEILDSDRRLDAVVLAISPNGKHLAGSIGGRGTVWEKKPRILSFGTNSFILSAITDSGFAGGASAQGGVIYEAHGTKVEVFDDWWGKKYPSVPLPAHVWRVFDLQEHEGDLYCLIGLEDMATEFRTTALAIAPLKRGKAGPKSK